MEIKSEPGMFNKHNIITFTLLQHPKNDFKRFFSQNLSRFSILFADIVGFTKMSSNKTASQLVGLLNDLFGRFDYLCTQCGCEKISTLGDCYYCVSGWNFIALILNDGLQLRFRLILN